MGSDPFVARKTGGGMIHMLDSAVFIGDKDEIRRSKRNRVPQLFRLYNLFLRLNLPTSLFKNPDLLFQRLIGWCFGHEKYPGKNGLGYKK